MLSHYLIAAWRNAVRDRLYTTLNVLGLGIGFAAAILIGLFVRDELSYDRFLPGYQDVYRVQATLRGQTTSAGTPLRMAEELTLAFPEIATALRLAPESLGLRHGQVEAIEAIETADPDFFAVLGFPLLRGDPATALVAPDSIVLTRSLAEKYFGTIDCLGQTLDVNQIHPVRVTGVAEDPPTNTSVGFSALLSSKTAFSAIATGPQQKGVFLSIGQTFLRLKPGTDAATLAARLPAFASANYPDDQGARPDFDLFLKPLADLHLNPYNPGTREINDEARTLYSVAATGVLILLLAGINFVNLVTARATRRALEVGVRKSQGALRRQLMVQFMGESVFFALAGMALGLALAELCLPSLNGFLDRHIAFEYGRYPWLAVFPVAAAVLVGVAAGIYPALILSSFPPALVLKSRSGGPIGGGKLRLILVVFQFSVTIMLVIATSVIYRQDVFASSQALRFDKDLILTVDLGGMPIQKTPGPLGVPRLDEASLDALHTRLAAVPGVRAIANSMVVPAVESQLTIGYRPSGEAGRPEVGLNFVPVAPGFFDLYGLHLIAGRDFSRNRADDKTSFEDLSRAGAAIINETAVHALGFADAAAAIGQEVTASLSNTDPGARLRQRIIGVVPDFPLELDPQARAAEPLSGLSGSFPGAERETVRRRSAGHAARHRCGLARVRAGPAGQPQLRR